MNILGRTFLILGLVPLGGFLLMFFTNGFGSFVELVSSEAPWAWWVIGGGLIMSVVGFVICIATGDDWFQGTGAAPRSGSDYGGYTGGGDNGYSGSGSGDRFENDFPYERDTLTGLARSDYRDNGNWTDEMGNQYEQHTDCWGYPVYEQVDDDDDD